MVHLILCGFSILVISNDELVDKRLAYDVIFQRYVTSMVESVDRFLRKLLRGWKNPELESRSEEVTRSILEPAQSSPG